MNKRYYLLLLIVLIACSQRNDFRRIKTGMHAVEVIRLTGKPVRKIPMEGAEWWLYADTGKHLIVISSDTVANVTNQADAMRVMENTLHAADSIRALNR